MDENRRNNLAASTESESLSAIESSPLLTAALLFVVLPLATIVVAIAMWLWK
jgi:hypothetical protein